MAQDNKYSQSHIEALRTTITQIEEASASDPGNPALLELKRIFLRRIEALESSTPLVEESVFFGSIEG
jgi:hypothetical protein